MALDSMIIACLLNLLKCVNMPQILVTNHFREWYETSIQ